MMNIVQLQDQLKNFSQDQLVREMQAPSGNAPQFLVLGEIMRRKRMQDDLTAQQAKDDGGTVAQEAVAAAGVPQGGIADMARAMAPSTDMTQNTGVQAMYAGGLVKKMKVGGKAETDPAVIAMANRAGMSVAQYLRTLGEEEAARVEAGAAQRAERNRMMTMEPIGDGVTFPTQEDLDRRFQQEQQAEQFAFDASRPLVAPAAVDMPTIPAAAGLPAISAAPEMPGAPFYLRSRDVAPEAGTTPTFLERMRGENRMSPPAESLVEDFGTGVLSEAPAAAQPPAVPTEFAENYDFTGGQDTPVPGVMERIFGAPALERIGVETTRTPAPPGQTTGTPLEVPEGGGRDLLPPEAQAQIAEAEQAAAEEAAAAATQGGTGGAGGAGGTGGAGGMSSYEQELISMLQNREKAAEQDKWLALAQVGLNLMSSTQPTLGGALGEAGLAGVEAARSARDQYDKDRLELMGALEQSRAARAKAAARGAGSASAGLGISAGTGRLLTQINADIERLDGLLANAAIMPPTTPEGEMQLVAAQQELNNKVAVRNAILYGGATTQTADDGIPNLADE